LNHTRTSKSQDIWRGSTLRTPHPPPRIVPSGHNLNGVDERQAGRLRLKPASSLGRGRLRSRGGRARARSSVRRASRSGARENGPVTDSESSVVCGGGGGWPSSRRRSCCCTGRRAKARESRSWPVVEDAAERGQENADHLQTPHDLHRVLLLKGFQLLAEGHSRPSTPRPSIALSGECPLGVLADVSGVEGCLETDVPGGLQLYGEGHG